MVPHIWARGCHGYTPVFVRRAPAGAGDRRNGSLNNLQLSGVGFIRSKAELQLQRMRELFVRCQLLSPYLWVRSLEGPGTEYALVIRIETQIILVAEVGWPYKTERCVAPSFACTSVSLNTR